MSVTPSAWKIVTSVSPANPIQLIPWNGYITNGVSQVTFILPLAPVIGDTFKVISNTSTFKITQNGGQQIAQGVISSTLGSLGYMVSKSAGDVVEITYVGANLFRGFSPQGTITLN